MAILHSAVQTAAMVWVLLRGSCRREPVVIWNRQTFGNYQITSSDTACWGWYGCAIPAGKKGVYMVYQHVIV